MKGPEPRAYPAPAPGDIVWCRFPQREEIRPAAKARPALVLSVMDESAPARVRVAYGTSKGLDRMRVTQFAITREDAAAYALSGLSFPTKFCMTNVVVLPYTDTWFAPAPGTPVGPSPRMGTLHAALAKEAERAFRATRSGR